MTTPRAQGRRRSLKPAPTILDRQAEWRPVGAGFSLRSAERRFDLRSGLQLAGRLLLLLFVCSASACTSTWTVHSTLSPVPLQWPYAPHPPKLSFVQSFNGFAPVMDGRRVLRAVVFGSDAEERDAFVLPVAVAVGGDGRIAVADLGRHCVHVYLPATQQYSRLCGSGATTMVSPVGVVFDDQLRLYVADSSGKLFRFAADGTPMDVVVSAGNDALQRPTGLAFSPRAQLLYVVDTLAHRVFALRPSGELAFSFGARGEAPGEFNFPTHIFRATSGDLYVTDALNFRVEVFDEHGKPRGAFGHHGDGSGDLAMPKGLAADGGGVIYVADAIFDNVQLFDGDGKFLLTLGQRGVDLGEFWLPAGLFIDAQGQLYVCDTYNHRIQVFQISEGYGHAAS